MKVAAAARRTDFPRRTTSRLVPSELRGPKEGPFLSLLAAGPVDIRSGPAGTLVRRFPAALYGSTPTAFLAIDQATERARAPLVPGPAAHPAQRDPWLDPGHAGQDSGVAARRPGGAGSQPAHGVRGREGGGSFPVCVGARSTPTPSGDFFIDQRIRTSPGGAYGPLALGLSAFSDVLTDWPGGGRWASTAPTAPSSIGRDVSHGCVRLRNADILALGNLVELGTPVFIRP